MARITIDHLTPEQLIAVTQALTAAEVDFESSQLVWTPAEARALLADLRDGQVQMLRLLVEWDGVLTSETLRSTGSSLRGSTTGPITKAIGRLTTANAIRSDLPHPAEPVYDPNVRGRQTVKAYRMDGPTVRAFRAAIDGADATP